MYAIVDKRMRHRVIARILESDVLPNQHALRARLLSEGIDATQGTLSRDLREMGVLKGPQGYALRAGAQGASVETLRGPLRAMLASAEPAGTMVVIKTEPGNAGALAVHIDNTNLPGVAGCVAGDDTIFVATRSTRQAGDLARYLLSLSGFTAEGDEK